MAENRTTSTIAEVMRDGETPIRTSSAMAEVMRDGETPIRSTSVMVEVFRTIGSTFAPGTGGWVCVMG